MNIDDNATRLFSTISVWFAAAAIFIFGFFKFNVNGDFAVILWFVIGLALAAGPVAATLAIWNWKPANPPKIGGGKPDDSRPAGT